MVVASLQNEYQLAHEEHVPHPYKGPRPDELFIHGSGSPPKPPVINNPVLVVAVGQVLNYPMKLVAGPGTLFARWDDGKTRFNIEEIPGDIRPRNDKETRSLMSVSDALVKEGNYFTNLNGAGAFAVFLQARGNCLEAQGKMPEAIAAYAEAHRLEPTVALYSKYLRSAVDTQLRSYNLDWKTIDDHNADRFNLEPVKQPINDIP